MITFEKMFFSTYLDVTSAEIKHLQIQSLYFKISSVSPFIKVSSIMHILLRIVVYNNIEKEKLENQFSLIYFLFEIVSIPFFKENLLTHEATVQYQGLDLVPCLGSQGKNKLHRTHLCSNLNLKAFLIFLLNTVK